LDQLTAAMATLPVPRALPTNTGAVVAVIGGAANLERTVDLVTTELSLGVRDVLWSGGGSGTATQAGPRLDRQIARRRASGRGSVVVLQAGPGLSVRAEETSLLEQAAPDYVLAAVSADCKRVDVEHWIAELVAVDALALWDLSGTRTPAELLGVLPIAFVEGEASSSLGWTLELASRAMARRQ